MTQIALTDLPDTVQTLLDRARETGEPLTITRNGIAIAIVSPIKKGKRAAFGAMKDTGKIIGDIVEPTSNLLTWRELP